MCVKIEYRWSDKTDELRTKNVEGFTLVIYVLYSVPVVVTF